MIKGAIYIIRKLIYAIRNFVDSTHLPSIPYATFASLMIKKISGIFFFLLFLAYFTGTCAFYHTHIIKGKKIVHSHFYKKNNGAPGHTHTDNEIQLIKFLSDYHLIIPGSLVVPLLTPDFDHEKLCSEHDFLLPVTYANTSPRAPPVT